MVAFAGYSGTSLPEKLGFKPGWTVRVIAAPDHYADLLQGAEGVTFDHGAGGPAQAVHVFLHDRAALGSLPDRLADVAPGGMLWVCWAKKSSTLHAGVTEDDLRAVLLPTGWVDVKVCAVDADWSGLKFLKRKT